MAAKTRNIYGGPGIWALMKNLFRERDDKKTIKFIFEDGLEARAIINSATRISGDDLDVWLIRGEFSLGIADRARYIALYSASKRRGNLIFDREGSLCNYEDGADLLKAAIDFTVASALGDPMRIKANLRIHKHILVSIAAHGLGYLERHCYKEYGNYSRIDDGENNMIVVDLKRK